MDVVMRDLRVLHIVFIMSAIMIMGVGEFVPTPANPDLKIMVFALGFVAVADLGIGFFLRRNILDPARETLHRQPDDANALTAWRSGHVLGFVFPETVVLFGLVVRLLMGNRELALPFYIAGTAVLILWMPRRPDA
jgi:F0F1-type ATP synthase membrane subunit c/vacuolar-type H+-ATPase subunit K